MNQPALRSSALRVLLSSLAAAVALLVVAVAPALGASTHPLAAEWSPGSHCNEINSVATYKDQYVYVFCNDVGTNGLAGSLRKFTPNGTPVPFTGTASYISGNELTENPFNPTEWDGHEREWGGGGCCAGPGVKLAVDNSSVHPGYIYAVGGSLFSEDLYIFAPDGEYVTSIHGGHGNGIIIGVDVDDNGYIYLENEGNLCMEGCARVSKYNPVNFHEMKRMVPQMPGRNPGWDPYESPCCGDIAIDSNESVWSDWGGYWGPAGFMGKIEADQWTTNLKAGYKDPNTVVAKPSPFFIAAFSESTCPTYWEQNGEKGFECTLPGYGMDVETQTNDVYAGTVDGIVPYSEGREGDPVHQDGPTFGAGKVFVSAALSIDGEGNVYAASAGKVVKFSRGFTLPTVTTRDALVTQIGHHKATVPGEIDPAGGGEITGCRIQWGSTMAYGKPPVSCNEALPYPNGSVTDVSADLPEELEVGHVYHYRFEAQNAHGWNIGGDHYFEARAVLGVESKAPTEVGRNEVTMQGQLDADGMPTEYWYEYGPTTSYGQNTLDDEGKGVAVTGAPGEVKPTPLLVGHLQEGKVYHYRLVAKNELGITRGQDIRVKTASPPEISGVGTEHIRETSADIHALINPNSYPTTYRFDYGTSVNYDHSVPVGEGELTGDTPQKVEAHLSDLPAGSTIHYRLVATNSWGTASTDDTTFNFRPPACPNAHIRQVTSSSYLPDCRAYELVSPGYAGAVALLPGEALNSFFELFAIQGAMFSPQNQGFATGPSRMMYIGSLGTIGSLDGQNTLFDLYLATRTNSGWVTSYPGLHGSEEKLSGGRVCSESMDQCIDHPGPLLFSGVQHPPSASPFLYDADGTRVGRLPTNVNAVPGGTEYQGDEQVSGDFSHYFFSTQTKFTPDGVTAAPGSVYDNDIADKTVTVVSYDAQQNPIQSEPSVAGDSTRLTGIAAASSDGFRVLMAGTTTEYCTVQNWPFKCPPKLDKPVRLYLREGDAVTYEVSRGLEVDYVGMSKDGSKVYFTTAEQLTPEDQDSSTDLYRWSAPGDQITLISQNGQLGSGDDCAASWTEGCGVQALQPKHWDYSEAYDQKTWVKGIDDRLAPESGDIYFYSPEDLVPGEVGGDGQRNLYLFRNGKLRLVATLDPDKPIERVTISVNGSHAAFLTKSSLTPYDSQGWKEVYTYDADSGIIRCASCNPSGAPPLPGEKTVAVAESGPFMANDGRTFFSTKESLVPQDTDGIRDVYEYVEGRPQLITSGTGTRDNTGGSEIQGFFFGAADLGLEAVSRNGTDVYFSSYEELAPQDQNGEFLKFYDARVGGGFEAAPDLGACAAADECHGVTSDPGTPEQIGTGGSLGSSGNVSTQPHHKKKHRKHRTHKKRHHKKSAKSHRSGRRA